MRPGGVRACCARSDDAAVRGGDHCGADWNVPAGLVMLYRCCRLRSDESRHRQFRDQLLWSCLLVLVVQSTTAAANGADVPAELAWLHSSLPAHCFIGVHAETFNSSEGFWDSGSWKLQPFKTTVDAERQAVYWHKDMVEDFYGEVWEYDDETVRLRQETFPKFPPPFEDSSLPWDVRPDKFRLYFSVVAASLLKGGKGRVLAPRNATTNWRATANTSTNLCNSWHEFEAGECAPYQRHFLDSAVYLATSHSLDTVFDGEASDAKWDAESCMRDLRDVVIINQEQSGEADGPT
eukprot:SAG31_NODE_11946_length_983_cov_0.949095_1_plen_292_part_10